MQRISTTVRLNRSTLEFDEAALTRLQQYLEESASLLEGDPDPQEILGDLEQAVADQCARRLPPERRVVTLAELEPALAEIGTVQVPGVSSTVHDRPATGGSRPLQQVSEGAVISGVCTGLGGYFGFNVAALRVFAVLLFLLTGGGMLLVYFTLMLLMPYAPLAADGRTPGWLPQKCRASMEYLRVKLHLAAN